MGKCRGEDDGLLLVLCSMFFLYVRAEHLSCCPSDGVGENWRTAGVRRIMSKVVN